MLKRQWLCSIVIIAASTGFARAEVDLGISFQQGRNGHPVVTEVRKKVGGYETLGSFLQLQPGDEVYTAYSDSINDGQGTGDTWDIESSRDLRWVLKNTTSRVGLTVKRRGVYIKSVATYEDKMENIVMPDGTVQTRVIRAWTLSGPKRVTRP